MSVFEWITENEGFFSGLVAIAALLGISGAVARLLWVRARRLGPNAGTGWRRWKPASRSSIPARKPEPEHSTAKTIIKGVTHVRILP